MIGQSDMSSHLIHYPILDMSTSLIITLYSHINIIRENIITFMIMVIMRNYNLEHRVDLRMAATIHKY